MSQVTEEIKSKIDIVDLVSGYITLKKAGRNFKANCPFHQESAPSFIVSPEKQIWHCFGCNEGGDIFSFVSKIEGLTFFEVVERLANKTNTILPTDSSKSASKSKTPLYKLNEIAASVYHKYLTQTKEGEEARKYLESRGLSQEVIKLFNIGFSPKNDLFLSELVLSKGYGKNELEESGLCYRYGQKYKDRFSGRITFPICDISGRTIGFTARVLDKTLPKYVNTPQTPIYNKSQVVFGLNLAKNAIKEEDFVILVEGNMDVVACFDKGIKNVVAVSGTAVTSSQLNIIGRFTHNLKIAFDSDEAGRKATEKTIEAALENDFNVSVISFDDTKDPADIVNENPQHFRDLVTDAIPAVEYFVNKLVDKYDIKTGYGKKMIAAESTKIINLLTSQVEKRHWQKFIANKLDVSEKDIGIKADEQTINKKQFKEISQDEIENMLFGLVLNKPKYIAFLVNNLSEDEILSQNKTLYLSILSFKNRKFSIKSYFQEFPELKEWASKLTLLTDELYAEVTDDRAGDEILFLIRKIKNRSVADKSRNLLLQIQEAEKEKNINKKNALLNEYNNLLQQKELL
jgi:DNA primase